MKRFESFGLDTRNECLWRSGAQISLPPRTFAVLRYLVENPGRLITHEELLDALWPETYVQPQVLRTYVLELRKLLGDDAGHPRYIQTLPKRGYCFVARVEEQAEEERALDARARSESTSESGQALRPAVPAAIQAKASPAQQTPEMRIVGRDAELAQLKADFEEASRGRRQVILVIGEVGIGKTALADAFSQWACGATIAHGQCVEGFGSKQEYYPVLEVLNQLCASEDSERACAILSAMAPAWLGVHRQNSAQTTEKERAASGALERLPGELCAALEELAAQRTPGRPLILIFEDLHCADEATLHLISALARRRAPAKLMIVATLRPHGGAMELQLKGIRQDLGMRRLCREMELQPLKRTAMRELLVLELRQKELPAGLAEFVHQHSEGNPLFAIALVEHLVAERFLARANGTDESGPWTQRAPFQEMEAGVPEGLARMIELEIERLSPEEQCLLEAGSLMQVAFPAWAVAAALNRDPAETEEACDGLARRLYFVERAGQDELPNGAYSTFYVFAHGLYREVLYRRQTASRRAQRHVRIAEKLEAIFAGREASVARDVAIHFEAAGNLMRAAESLRAAAELARKRRAEAEASELLERALRIAENLCETEHGTAAQAMIEEIRETLKIGELAVEKR